MPERRRRFSPQFKAEAVQMVIETGKPTAEVARDLGIHDGTLGNWVNAWRREAPRRVRRLDLLRRWSHDMSEPALSAGAAQQAQDPRCRPELKVLIIKWI
jgi:transposase-like protein